jgi:hypothetical protein
VHPHFEYISPLSYHSYSWSHFSNIPGRASWIKRNKKGWPGVGSRVAQARESSFGELRRSRWTCNQGVVKPIRVGCLSATCRAHWRLFKAPTKRMVNRCIKTWISVFSTVRRNCNTFLYYWGNWIPTRPPVCLLTTIEPTCTIYLYYIDALDTASKQHLMNLPRHASHFGIELNVSNARSGWKFSHHVALMIG